MQPKKWGRLAAMEDDKITMGDDDWDRNKENEQKLRREEVEEEIREAKRKIFAGLVELRRSDMVMRWLAIQKILSDAWREHGDWSIAGFPGAISAPSHDVEKALKKVSIRFLLSAFADGGGASGRPMPT